MKTLLLVLAIVAAVILMVLGFGWLNADDPHPFGWLGATLVLFLLSQLPLERYFR